MHDFNLLKEAHSKARKLGVNYTLHYSEAEDNFYFSIESVVPSEEWVGKNHTLHIAVGCVCEWLDSIA